MRKCLRLFLLFLVLLAFSSFSVLWGQRIRVADYSFKITGKTKESTLRDFLVPKEAEEFHTEEELQAALDAKRQLLMNKRIFMDIDCHYELEEGVVVDGVRLCHVFFLIDDAYTKLFVPYPKYDSNYGLRLGLKVYNKNLFGRFADLSWVSHVSQNNLSFKTPSLFSQLTVNNLSFYGIKFDLDAEFLVNLLETSESYLEIGLDFSNMKLGSVPVRLHPWFRVDQTGGDIEAGWTVKEFGNELAVGLFAKSVGGFLIRNKTVYSPLSNSFETDSGLEYSGIPDTGTSLGVWTKNTVEPWRFTNLKIGPTFDFDCLLFDWLKWSNSLSEFNYWEFVEDLLFRLSLRWDTGFSYSGIDWKGDFRNGVEFSLASGVEVFLTPPRSACESVLFYGLDASLVCFPFSIAWFNPSFRLTAFHSTAPVERSADYVGDHIRGVMLKNPKIQGDVRRTLLTLNIDLMFKFISVSYPKRHDKRFAQSFISPFIDWVLVEDATRGGRMANLCGVGFDLIVVLDKYPGFPLRASFGVNLAELADKLRGNLNGTPEHELYLGMDFFY